MVIKVIFNHVMHEVDPITFPKTIEFVSYYDSNTTLQQLFDDADQPYADLSEYYYLSGAFSFNERKLPFIINSNGKIDWNIYFQDAKVIDFISTHGVKNNLIISKIGYPQLGGPGFKDLIDIWNAIYPILDQFVTVIGLGTLFINSGKRVHSLFYGKDVAPQNYFDLIYLREKWNHFELAKLLDINSEDAKQLLKIFGYSYDKSMLMFVQQPVSLELREKLSKINVHDIE